MIALGLDILLGLGFSAVVAALFIASAHQQEARRPTQDRETKRRKYWGYV